MGLVINFDNWRISTTGNDLHEGENDSKRVDVVGNLPAEYSYMLHIRVRGTLVDVVLLTPTENGVGTVLDNAILSYGNDRYEMQVWGLDGIASRSTNKITLTLTESITGEEQWHEVPYAFMQIEARIADMNAHPPVPDADTEKWKLWNPETQEYEVSAFPVPKAADGRGIDHAEIEAGVGGNHLIIYYDDDTSEDAGVVGESVEIDDTLTVEGAAADAKATGDAIGAKLSKSGGTMTGTLDMDANTIRLGDTVSLYEDGDNELRLEGEDDAPVKIVNVATPTANTDAANKAYVDAHSGGIPDAPSDGNQYARKDGAWVVVEGDTPPEVTNAIATGGIGWTETDGYNITWDGVVGGRDVATYYPDENFVLVKVAEYMLPTDLDGAVLTAHTSDGDSEIQLVSGRVIDNVIEYDDDKKLYFDVDYPYYAMANKSGVFGDNWNFPSAGLYVYFSNDAFISNVRKGTETVHEIDGKYLPDIPTQLSQLTGDSTHRTVTDTEKAAWDGKQDAISDLAAIRSGAALGATALQTAPVSSVNGKTGAVNLTPADLGIGSVFALKGSKPTYADLPATGNTIGDVWYVIADSVGYIWLNDGTVDRWEQLGMEIDLSAYQTTAITDTAGYFTTDTVEGALAEIGAELSGINTLIGSGVIT